MREVQYSITQQDHQLLMFAMESAGQWLVARLYDNAVPDPLPKLSLGGPKLSPVATYNKRRLTLLLFLFVLLFFGAHVVSNTLVPLRGNSCSAADNNAA